MFRMRFVSWLLVLAIAGSATAAERPRLVVQITIDQMRGDIPLRYHQRFGEGGFRFFLEHGTWYAAAHQPHARTETIVGHTTLATGAYPSRHGMITNKWVDRKTGSFVLEVEDPKFPGLPIDGGRAGKGASPRAILTTTFSDELVLATGGKAKVFSVSGKDRGAVPLAGHVGKAFWFSEASRCFVTSTFYYQAYPRWVKEWCARGLVDGFRNEQWDLMHPRDQYLYRDVGNVYPPGTPPEQNMKMLEQLGFGRTFPHPFGTAMVGQAVTLSPELDALTADFTRDLIRAEHLGDDEIPDYLAIGFSSTDTIGHWFSHSSLEAEDNVLRLDRTIADLLAFIDEEVGLDRTLVVLAGDHGGPDYPEFLESIGIDTGRTTFAKILEAAQKALRGRYGTKTLIRAYAPPYIYLDRRVIERHRLDRAQVERVVARAVMEVEGVLAAVPSDDSPDAETDPDLIARIRRNYHPGRSGDVYIVQDPQWQIDDPASPDPPLLQHGSPWAYDTFVPVAFAGAGVGREMVFRSVATVDVAATLAAILQTRFPSGNAGAPLVEVTGRE